MVEFYCLVVEFYCPVVEFYCLVVELYHHWGRYFSRSEFRHTSLWNIWFFFSEHNYISYFLIFEIKKSPKFQYLVKSGGRILLLHGRILLAVEFYHRSKGLYWLNMFLKNTLLCSLIITLIALILDTFMFSLNMSLKIILAWSLIITQITRIHYTFMYSLRKWPQLVKFFSHFGHSVNISHITRILEYAFEDYFVL